MAYALRKVDPDVLATERAAVLSELATLTPREREALLLVARDGLAPVQAAKVAGCSAEPHLADRRRRPVSGGRRTGRR